MDPQKVGSHGDSWSRAVYGTQGIALPGPRPPRPTPSDGGEEEGTGSVQNIPQNIKGEI